MKLASRTGWSRTLQVDIRSWSLSRQTKICTRASKGSKSEQNIILIIQGALWRSQWTLCKGGAVGIKMRPLLDRLSQKQSIEMRRETIIRSLILYLGEKEEELFEDCLDSRSDVSNHILKILVVHGADEDPVDVSILVEGHEILPGCNCTAKACSLLMGLIYALNLAYPPTLRYTFEVFQKLMLELDGLKLSPKVNTLKLKLLC
nr:uncharacterized protein LOC133622280 isoform X2 [Nerophis lumbriciformis]